MLPNEKVQARPPTAKRAVGVAWNDLLGGLILIKDFSIVKDRNDPLTLSAFRSFTETINLGPHSNPLPNRFIIQSGGIPSAVNLAILINNVDITIVATIHRRHFPLDIIRFRPDILPENPPHGIVFTVPKLNLIPGRRDTVDGISG